MAALLLFWCMESAASIFLSVLNLYTMKLCCSHGTCDMNKAIIEGKFSKSK